MTTAQRGLMNFISFLLSKVSGFSAGNAKLAHKPSFRVIISLEMTHLSLKFLRKVMFLLVDLKIQMYVCFKCCFLFIFSGNIFEQGLETLGLGVVVIIGAAIGLVLLITIILCIVCCCCCGKSNDSNQKQYRAPPTPRPGSYPSHASNYSSYSSSASTTAGRPPYPMHYPPHYPPIHNGGYAVAYNQTNGRMEFPHKV